jgi:hypothetical protein
MSSLDVKSLDLDDQRYSKNQEGSLITPKRTSKNLNKDLETTLMENKDIATKDFMPTKFKSNHKKKLVIRLESGSPGHIFP